MIDATDDEMDCPAATNILRRPANELPGEQNPECRLEKRVRADRGDFGGHKAGRQYR